VEIAEQVALDFVNVHGNHILVYQILRFATSLALSKRQLC
jgi:hypothetical protein